MWQDKQSALLKEELEALLQLVPDTNKMRICVKEPLIKSGRGLSAKTAHDRPWPLLPLIICEAICGKYEHALPAAAALQLLMAAGDVFDDVEDADSPDSLCAKYDPAVALNAATTLLILAERAVLRLKIRGIDDRRVVCAMDIINSLYTTACAGQHLDLSLKVEKTISEDVYLKIINMKSASQIQCACHIGALLANAGQEMVETFANFGCNLGMAAQITNDIQGVIRGNDILERKITLPVIYCLTQSDGIIREQIRNTFSGKSESVLEPEQIKDFLFRTGAIHYAMIKLDFYKQKALNILSQVELAGVSTERLKLFLE